MPDPHSDHRQDVVLDRVDDSVVANAHTQEAGSILQGARTRRPCVTYSIEVLPAAERDLRKVNPQMRASDSGRHP